MVAAKRKNVARSANALSKINKQYTPVLLKLQEGTQTWNILRHLISRGSITNAEAVANFDCYRLSARIADLRHMGVDIETHIITKRGEHGNINYARYELREGTK